MGGSKGNTATAEKAKYAHRDVDVYKEEIVLYAASEPEDGLITEVRIYNSSFEKIFQQTYSSYEVEIGLSNFKSGNYTVKVLTENSPVHTDYFSL